MEERWCLSVLGARDSLYWTIIVWPTQTRSVGAQAVGWHSSFSVTLKHRKQVRFLPAGQRLEQDCTPLSAPPVRPTRPAPRTCLCSAVSKVQWGSPVATQDRDHGRARQQGPQRQHQRPHDSGTGFSLGGAEKEASPRGPNPPAMPPP